MKVWTKAEEKELFDFIGSKFNEEAAQMFAKEKGRGYGGVQYHYYQLLRNNNPKQENTTKIENMNTEIRHHKVWSAKELGLLSQYRTEGKSFKEIADLLQRTAHSISTKASKVDVQNRKFNTSKTTRTPIADYIAKHPEVIPQQEKITAVVMDTKGQPKIENPVQYQLLKGSEIKIQITNMRIENDHLILTF